jgi:hypothetical protein
VKTLLRLYPRAWRDRYGDELLALLEDRPASPLDLLDLIRGALDARLHPQLAGSAGEPTERSVLMSDRLPGLAAIGGGILVLVATALAAIQPVFNVGDGGRDLTMTMLLWSPGMVAIDLALLTAAARRLAAGWSGADSLLAVLAVGAGLVWFTGWPGILVAIWAFPIVTITAVVRYLRAVGAPGWIIAGSVVAAAVMVAVHVDNNEIWFLAPVALLAIMLGLNIVVRPVPRAGAASVGNA